MACIVGKMDRRFCWVWLRRWGEERRGSVPWAGWGAGGRGFVTYPGIAKGAVMLFVVRRLSAGMRGGGCM